MRSSQMLLVAAAAWAAVAAAAAEANPISSKPSAGCRAPTLPPGQQHRLPVGKTAMREFSMTDRNNLTRSRRYAVHLPSSYRHGSAAQRPLPLLLYLHGQTGTAKGSIPPYIKIGAPRRGRRTSSCRPPCRPPSYYFVLKGLVQPAHRAAAGTCSPSPAPHQCGCTRAAHHTKMRVCHHQVSAKGS